MYTQRLYDSNHLDDSNRFQDAGQRKKIKELPFNAIITFDKENINLEKIFCVDISINVKDISNNLGHNKDIYYKRIIFQKKLDTYQDIKSIKDIYIKYELILEYASNYENVEFDKMIESIIIYVKENIEGAKIVDDKSKNFNQRVRSLILYFFNNIKLKEGEDAQTCVIKHIHELTKLWNNETQIILFSEKDGNNFELIDIKDDHINEIFNKCLSKYLKYDCFNFKYDIEIANNFEGDTSKIIKGVINNIN